MPDLHPHLLPGAGESFLKLVKPLESDEKISFALFTF